MADGRDWPGFQVRFCPVCRTEVGTHREPVDDQRGELVAYHEHQDSTGARCLMAGERAAIKAVAFTATDTGIDQRTARERMLSRPQGSHAADELLARLNREETRQ
ncbi:hypothetical protein SEA_FLAGSTAFF_39 [Mycobacterium phage FlagStaff]|uniref:Uncharacterized protein n=1 Tax=Mycobacterium phage FlagStaff TaxID=1647304 RepID=A0A0F6YQ64_9CAUD|nr:hypothetical protein AVT49_gp39 [Mycobacterium phage FlagStaff]AKF14476.1 hypothetical protein SEA_FLAGSTAFF_39 [Mycobacterium phage FlagStaff]